MGLLVVDNGVQLALEGGLVYAMLRANVLRKQNPFGGMLLLFPRLEVTQGVLVSLRERGTVNHVCIAYLTGGYRLIVHPLSRKKSARSLEYRVPGCFSCIFLSRSTDLVVPSGIVQRRLRT